MSSTRGQHTAAVSARTNRLQLGWPHQGRMFSQCNFPISPTHPPTKGGGNPGVGQERKNDPSTAVQPHFSTQVYELWSTLRTAQTRNRKRDLEQRLVQCQYHFQLHFYGWACLVWCRLGRVNITRLNNVFCLCWWFASVLGVKSFPLQLRQL